jgi:hypothetical protein
MNGDLDDKQRIVQRFGQQEAYRLFIGHGQQAMVSFKNRRWRSGLMTSLSASQASAGIWRKDWAAERSIAGRRGMSFS